jgi:hypothetical protein
MDFSDDDRRLDAAVSLGIISAEQAAQIRALVPPRPRRALPQALGATAIAYGIGALTVLIAMGWFLSDRWEYLGPGGVLAVVAVYGALFALVAERMRREGFPLAEGIAALLAVALVPLAVIALSELLSWFPQMPVRACNARAFAAEFRFEFWTCRGLELTLELATLAAAIAAWRRSRFSLFALVVGGIAMRFVFLVAAAAFGGENGIAATAWLWMACASLAAAAAYVLERRPPGEHDVAQWLHLLSAFAAAVASVTLLNQFDGLRHLLLAAAFVAFTFSLRLRRGIWTLLGLAWFVGYLGWLAGEVFRDTPVFPIILAALGIGVIVVTVWIQRNRERLIARFGGVESGALPSFPGGVGLLLLPLVVVLLKLPTAVELDRAVAAEARSRLESRRVIRARERRRESADSADTPPAPIRRAPASARETVTRPRP